MRRLRRYSMHTLSMYRIDNCEKSDFLDGPTRTDTTFTTDAYGIVECTGEGFIIRLYLILTLKSITVDSTSQGI